jgi:hypothetical protein
VDARAFHDVKGAGEGVLMDVRGPIDPKEHVDVEVFAMEDRDGWLAKRGLYVSLRHERGRGADPPENAPRIGCSGRRHFTEGSLGDLREGSLVETGTAPTFQNRLAEVLKGFECVDVCSQSDVFLPLGCLSVRQCRAVQGPTLFV